MNGKDMDVISDDDFYNLYLLFKQTKIDMSKVMIGSPDSSTQNSEIRLWHYLRYINSKRI